MLGYSLHTLAIEAILNISSIAFYAPPDAHQVFLPDSLGLTSHFDSERAVAVNDAFRTLPFRLRVFNCD